jgi:hypothetical protein
MTSAHSGVDDPTQIEETRKQWDQRKIPKGVTNRNSGGSADTPWIPHRKDSGATQGLLLQTTDSD